MQNKWVRNSILIIAIGFVAYAFIYFIRSTDLPEPVENTSQLKSSVAAFNAPQTLITALSDNGIGKLESWKAYDEGVYMASSDYFQTGTPGKNGIANQLSYSVIGNSKNYVSSVELILIVNNKEDINNALLLIEAVTTETFKDIHRDVPNGLMNAIKKPQNFSYDTANFRIKLHEEWNGLSEWHLTLFATTQSL